jgi:hypothetical protein
MSTVFSREVEDTLQRICRAVGSPLAKQVSQLVDLKDWDALVSLECDPRNYNNPYTYRGDAICVSFLRKAKELPTTKFDKPAKALENFWAAERDCYRTNERLSPLLYGDYSSYDDVVKSIVDLARQTVRHSQGLP